MEAASRFEFDLDYLNMVLSGRKQNLSLSVFSPSSARVAASTARDWSFVDSWLLKIFPDGRLPNYERNAATLAALLTLASVNEVTAADQDLLSTARKVALTAVTASQLAPKFKRETTPCGQNRLALLEFILQKVTNHLTRKGQVALGALADTSVQHKRYITSSEVLGRELVNLQISLCETEQMATRINALNEHLIIELQSSKTQHVIPTSTAYILPIEIPKQNLELQRKTRSKAKQISDALERRKLSPSVPRSPCTLNVVCTEERQLLDLLASRKNLASQVAAFRRLPSHPGKAKNQLEELQKQLRELLAHRDQVFEGLVVQASPHKHR
ncbi:hypothetical protein E4U21_002999 [Claviceps maximensis]|nr:hypothetical protein E4U21_002999 [Claviceps maximensis]